LFGLAKQNVISKSAQNQCAGRTGNFFGPFQIFSARGPDFSRKKFIAGAKNARAAEFGTGVGGAKNAGSGRAGKEGEKT